MTSLELLNLITNGGPMAILGVAIWALLTGRLVPRWTHEAALAQKEAELAEVVRREAELWQLLKRTAGWVDAAAIVAERATHVATQAAAVVGGYRDAHPPPLSPPGDGPAPVSADEPERPTPALVEALERHLDARVEELADLRARLTIVEEQVNWLRTQVRVQQRAPEGGDDASNRKLP